MIFKPIKTIILNVLWIAILLGFIYAFIQVNKIDSPEKGLKVARIKAKEIKACFDKIDDTSFKSMKNVVRCSWSLKVQGIDLNEPTSKKSTSTQKDKKEDPIQTEVQPEEEKKTSLLDKSVTKTSNKEVISLAKEIDIAEYDTKDYNRSDWKHWNKVRNCWDIREQLLYERAVEGSVILLDKNRKKTDTLKKACYIKSGKWIDEYTGETLTDIGSIDIDHIVPLKLVSGGGGGVWIKKIKEKYANDTDVLSVVSSKTNRGKGAKPPSKWLPSVNTCRYAKKYLEVAKKYRLSITKEDKEALINCNN